MKLQILVTAALVAAVPTLSAQDHKDNKPGGEHQTPQNPKTPEHDAFAVFAGNWDCTIKSSEAGKPASESKLTEHAELICNGLYLKATMAGEYEGKQCSGTWILGYDPSKKGYAGLYVENQSPAVCLMDAKYDAKAKTWAFSGNSPQGPFTSTLIVKDSDTTVETVVSTDEKGNKSTMEITRKRTKMAPAAVNAASIAKAPSAEHAELHKVLGEWDAVMKMQTSPDAPVQDIPATEKNVTICDGAYVWSDYRSNFMGQPFEGHALCGYDASTKKYTCFWFDNMSPTWAASTGTLDASKKAMTLAGTAKDHSGQPTTTHEVTTWKDDNTRHMTMESKGKAGTEKFEITFTRKVAAKPAK